MRKGSLIYSLILLFILGMAILLLPAGAQTITASVKFDPNRIDLSRPAPSVVKATIRFESGAPESVKDINRSTILLEGTLPASSTYLIPGALVAEFDGYMVKNIMLAKIAHMGLDPNLKVYLTVTGNVNATAGGTPFSGTGYIKARAPHSPPPP